MENKVIKYPAIGAIYDHCKGGKYEVLTLSKHTDW